MKRRDFLQTMAATALVSPAAAQGSGAESFYRGKTITLLVATSPGGNFDFNGRLAARHLGRFMPGNPNVVVQNVPGAGGLLLAQRLANTAERDGLTIAIIERGVPQIAYLGDPNARFDPLRFNWLGSFSSYEDDAYLLLVNKGFAAQTIDDLRKPGLVARLGGNSPGSTNLTFALLARDLLKLNVQVIRGYHGAAPMFLAMQSGELDGQVIGYGSVTGAQKTLWEAGKFRPLLQFARRTRLPALPDVPTAREIVHDPETLAILEFAEIPFFMALPFAAPPDVPAERVAALQTAFSHMMRDQQFVADARQAGFEITPVDGQAVHDLVQKMASTPKPVIDRFSQLISQKS